MTAHAAGYKNGRARKNTLPGGAHGTQYLFSSVRMVIFGDTLKIYIYQNEA